MKNSTKLLLIVTLITMPFIGFSQTLQHNHVDRHHEHKGAHGQVIDEFRLPLDFDKDSLVGFDEKAAWDQAKINYDEEWAQARFVAVLKRNFIDFNYGAAKPMPSEPTVQAPCTNVDFETGNASGWTLTQGPHSNSQTMAGCCPTANTANFSVVTAGNDINIGAALQRVPPGAGNYTLLLGRTGQTAGGLAFRARQTFLVTPQNSAFMFRYAIVLNAAPHSCTEQPFFNVRFTDASGNIIPCSNYAVTAIGTGCTSGDASFITSGAMKYRPWSTSSFDLTPYLNTNVSIEFTVGGCIASQGAHGGYAYIDASCLPMTLNLNGTDIPVGQTTTNFCSVATNTLTAPLGFTSYTWSGPGVTGATTQSITTSTPGTYSVTLGMAGTSCSSPVLYSNFVISPKPIADFNFTTTACQSTFDVPFSDGSTLNGGPAISNWWWDFNNDNVPEVSPSTQNPTYTFPAAGTYSVELKVSNGGCYDSIVKTVVVNPSIIANFNNTSGCLNTPTSFTAAPTPSTGIASHAWNFGDGPTIYSGSPITHTYLTPGPKVVTYTVTNTAGCPGIFTKTITINPNPVTTITGNTVCLNQATTFGNTSSVLAPDAITNWDWDFNNDGTVDNTTQTPTNTYATPGTYTVELRATTNNGCKDSTTVVVKVNALPTATFTPVNACVNNNIVLNNTSSITAPDNITYAWNFGVGANPATSTLANPTPLMYSTGGTKNITLNLTSNNTCTATITKTVEVYAQPVANFSSTSVCQGTATAYTDISTPTGSITAWSWDYTSDNVVDNTSSGTPTNLFPTSGTYTTTLIVTNVNGCRDTISLPVNVWGHSIPNFTANSVCIGTSTSFSNTTNYTTNPNTGGLPTWAWSFGDGIGTSGLQHPSYTYAGAGGTTYNVTLTVTTTNGCVDQVVRTVTINALPVPAFTAANACPNFPVVLNNTSSVLAPATVQSQAWDFGTGAAPFVTSTAMVPTGLNYSVSGIKTITLTVTANTTCSASVTGTVQIYAQPVANFSSTSVCQGTATAYTDLSTSTGAITGWSWDFTSNGSADNLTSATPTNTFASSGTFTTTLIATDVNGCKDTIGLPVNVWGHTIPDFTPDRVCFGTSSQFTNLTNETANPNTGTGTTYAWGFGDGNTSALTNPSHAYTMNGNVNAVYSVTLTATTGHNCVDNIVKPVNVYAVPTASFTADSVCLGSPTHMVNASNGNGNVVNTYEWDFLNDGIDVTGVPNPNYTFPAFGSNVVSYTVSTSPVVGLVCKNTTNTITVWVNPNPIPDFTFNNNCINAQPNSFNASSSSIAIGTNTAYVWAYGNGVVSAPSAVSTATYSYGAAGVYNVTLTVTSNKGCQTAITKQVEVYQKPFMAISNTIPCDQAAMTFTAVSQPNSGAVSNYYWDFNNSITTIEANGQVVNYNFPGPGSHTIHLVSETNNLCRDTIQQVVYVNYLPQPDFTVNDPDGCPTHCVVFTDATPSIPGPAQLASWTWSLGDGSNSVNNNTSANVSHCYDNNSSNQLAQYDVKLTVTTTAGCSTTITKSSFITVFPVPIANYTVNPNPGNVVEPLIYFTNHSQDYTKWWWSFGDGPFKTDSVNVNPTHFYDETTAMVYYSNLIVMNQYGCSDTAYVPVEIGPEFTFYIPNAFSPSNDDGINDYFNGKGIGIAKYEMWVFDRWGERVFYTDDIEKGWNGKVQGKSAEGKQEVYVWKVKLVDVLGKKHDYIGHVTLLK